MSSKEEVPLRNRLHRPSKGDSRDCTRLRMAPRLRNPFKRNLRECEEVRDLMSDYVDGELADEGCRRVERHVRFCRPCRRVLGNLHRTLGRLSHLSESPPPGSDDAEQVAERLRSCWRERV